MPGMISSDWLQSIPEPQRAAAQQAVSSALGSEISAIEQIHGGASGALAFRIEAGAGSYLLRLETVRGPWRNPHQYACLETAAKAGVAPPVRYADDATGALILDFIRQQPLTDFPGGPEALAAACGKLIARLQVTEKFPALGNYRMFVKGLLDRMRTLFAPGLLDPHAGAFARIFEAYPWDGVPHVSSHNDPNPRNLLFDGERLWLVDWETAFRNDPVTDIAIVADSHAATPELEQMLLRAWLDRDPSRGLRARLTVMRCVTRLWYAGLVLTPPPAPESPFSDVAAPTPDEFRMLIATGTLPRSEIKTTFGKMMLAGFLSGVQAPRFEEALQASGGDR